MAEQDIIDSIVAELDKRALPADMGQPEKPGLVGESQRTRTMAQGLTLGGADEAEAFLRSQATGLPYDEVLKEVRGSIEEYRRNNPGRATMDEIAGAALPMLTGLVTGGSTIAASAGRLWPAIMKAVGTGIAEGSAYGFMSGEGGDAETYWGQALNRGGTALKGAAVGAVAGPVGLGVVTGGGTALRSIIDYANRKFGPRMGRAAEMELERVIRDSGLTMDEAVKKIESGELLAEANSTLRSVARSYYARDTGAAQILADTYKKRPDELRGETMDYLQRNMTEGADPNVLRQFTANDADLRKQKGAEYDRVFEAAPPLSDDATAELVDAFSRVPSAAKELDTLFRAETGQAPFFKVVDGEIVLERNPTLKEAEVLRRGIRDRASALYTQGAGEAGTSVKGVANNVRGLLDDASPELKDVRGQWRTLETAKGAFDEGRKALSRSPDEVAIEFERVSQMGDDAVKAYRAGVVDAYRRKASTGSNKSLPGLLANEERKEGAILRIVFPGDNLDEMLGKAGRAAKAQEASNQILGGSQTAITDSRQKQIGGSLLQDGVEAFSGSPMAALRVAGQVIKELRPGLTNKDVQQVAKMMVEGNPEAFKKQVIGVGTSDALVKLATSAINRLENASVGAVRRSAQPVGLGLLGRP